ncbi:hypothetical protein BO94DRAFT_317917 [Aspergillus sclerotioniger CBS 115572]|uniref:Uncharacterized protein n=1 Tax=Aspergillus sclerotioniger CBS 115572 TaxID=1450535 RepID=A0A317X787_9EURO|nr:hypothetical protein BO94DRAFT_317917 [Aspergillus sclerotioniger CBS 115572]PWY94051.1 hypothetical protein BO94DRAFT_317917 [Aspergillus sclerotioniger CBS 115572]
MAIMPDSSHHHHHHHHHHHYHLRENSREVFHWARTGLPITPWQESFPSSDLARHPGHEQYSEASGNVAGEDDKEWMTCSIDRPSATSL